MDGEKRSGPPGLPTSLLLPAIFVFGFLLRLYAGRSSLQGGNVLMMGFDEFYHMRRILYTVAHFPNTLWFDSYLDYPRGYYLTWPPLFDQFMAAVSLALGQHSKPGIEMVVATIPTVVGVVAVPVVYYLVKETFDRRVALMSAFMTALAPYYLQKSMLGETGHHWLVELWFMLAVMFMVLALNRKEKRYIYATAAGIAMIGEAYTWLGSSAYFFFFLVYAFLQMTVDLRNGSSSKETVKTVLLPFGLTIAFTLPFWNEPWLFPTFFGAAALTAAIVVLFAISGLMLERKVPWPAFPIAISVIAGAFIVLSRAMGDFWIFSKVNQIIITGGDYLMGGLMIGKIAEAEPLFARPEILFSNFVFSNLGWNLVFSVAGLLVLISYLRSNPNAEKYEARLLFLVFVVLTLVLTVGQIRFLEISTISMGITISILFFWAVAAIEKYQNGGGLRSKFLIFALFVVLVLPTVKEAAAITSIRPEISGDWYSTLHWLEENSNTTSWYDNPSKTPEYGVLSWWDYGNWILYEAKRPVVANNFQTGIEDASKFYLSEDESTATSVLDARRAKYVITDYDMLYGKLPALAIWANKDPSEYQSTQDLGNYMVVVPTKKLYQTTLALLHFIDGSSLGHFRLIYESSTIVGQNPPTSRLKIFEYVPGALIKVSNAHGQKVVALLNLTSNQGRRFIYVNEGTSEVRVPYSTEERYETRAVTPYLIVSGNDSTGIRRKNLNITEDDVLHGKVLEVTT